MSLQYPENDIVELIIPTCIEKTSNCLHFASNKDITKQHKIKLKNMCNQQLYIEKETDLRDILRQYCMYKKLTELINNEMCKLDLDFQVTDTCESQNNNPRINSTQVDSFRDAAYQFVQTAVNPYCDDQCGKTLYVKRPPPLFSDSVSPNTQTISNDTNIQDDPADTDDAQIQTNDRERSNSFPIYKSVVNNEEYLDYNGRPKRRRRCHIL